MGKSDMLDRQAVAAASQYMGTVAWPTIFLGLALGLAYIAAVAMSLTGAMSLWLGVPVVAMLTYLSYTILHESVHGSITGKDGSLRWLNKALGYIAAWIVMIPLNGHRHEHMAHHRYANDEVNDPDFHVGKMYDSPVAPVRAALQAWASQYRYYASNRWAAAPAKEKVFLLLELIFALFPRLAVIAAGYWVEGLALFVLAWLIGAVFLLYLFAYVVHRPHEDVGRYVDTSTILMPRPLHSLVTWLWMFQNYHSIHHLFPRVPFYKYAKLYDEIEDVMSAKGAPIYRVTSRGLEPSSATLVNQRQAST